MLSQIYKIFEASRVRVGGCVTALAAWASGPSALASRVPWGRRHRGTRGPTRRASVRGYAGVYTDWRKRPLGAVLVHSCTLLRRCNTARPAGDSAGATKKGRTCGLKEGRLLVRRLTKRRSLRLPCCAECAFPLHHRPGGVGRNPPASLRGTMESGSTGQMRSSNPPPGCGGGCAGDPQAPAWGLTARKSAVWAEGLADGAPWPGRDTIRLLVVG